MTEVWVAIIVALAHAIETTTGFGGTIIALALGVHLVPLETLIVSLVAVGWLQAAWILSRDFRHVALGLLARTVIPCAAVGGVLGVLMRSYLQSSSLKAVLGVFVVVVAGVELYRLARTVPSKPLQPWFGGFVLAVGGVFHGLFASGGPAIVYWTARMIGDRRAFRATLAALWLVLNTALLVTAFFTGAVDSASISLAAAALPGLAAGILIGEVLHTRIPQRAFRGTVNGLLLLTGLTLLW